MADCLFCKIVTGDIPAERVAESARTIAFRDINPQAPTHVLVIPRDHYPDLAALAAADGYRVVFNTGPRAGQTVFHVHAHVLGGRDMTWPPG